MALCRRSAFRAVVLVGGLVLAAPGGMEPDSGSTVGAEPESGG